MANYNFEDEGKDFGETIRIGEIHHQVKENGSSQQPPRRRPTQSRGPRRQNQDERFRNILKWAVVIGIVIFICVFVLAFLGTRDPKVQEDTQNTNQTQTSDPEHDASAVLTETEGRYGVIETKESSKLWLYDLKEKEDFYATIAQETVIEDQNGQIISAASLDIGDIILITFEDNSTQARNISIPESVWTQENVEEVTIDTQKKALSFGSNEYLYTQETKVFYDGEEIPIQDLTSVDVLTLKGMNNLVFSIVCEKYHGTVVLINRDGIEEGTIVVDDEEELKLEETEQIPLPAGTHKIVVKGKDISDFEKEIFVMEGEEQQLDLSEVVQKKGTLILSANQQGYAVMIDGQNYTQDSNIYSLPLGEHTVELLLGGYENWKKTVTIGEDPVELYAEFVAKDKPQEPEVTQPTVQKGTVTIFSDPGWAKISVDGTYLGVAPVMANLDYGSHVITAELEDYQQAIVTIDVNSPDRSVTIQMEK